MNSAYRLDVTARKNGTFDHSVVEVATGKVVGTRNSRRQYSFATVARANLDWYIANARDMLTWRGHNDVFYAQVRASLERHEAMKAAAEEYAPGVLSFNTKPTPVPANQSACLTFLGFAQRAA